jgi:hypothetical protein
MARYATVAADIVNGGRGDRVKDIVCYVGRIFQIEFPEIGKRFQKPDNTVIFKLSSDSPQFEKF